LSAGEETKRFNLSADEEKLIGFKLSGSDVTFKSLVFEMNVNNSKSCKAPLAIDLFNDGVIDWQAENTTLDYDCSFNSGCFYSNNNPDEVFIGEKPYCERIVLPVGKKFKIGAWIKKGIVTSYEEDLLEATMYSSDKEWLAYCNIPEPSPLGRLVGCEIDYENEEEQEVFVCVNALIDTDYVTKTETNGPCGFFSYVEDFEGDFVADYYIFISTPRFSNIGKVELEDFNYKVDEYISEVYNNSCKDDCIIPVNLISGSNASLSVFNASLSYTSKIGGKIEKNIYDLEEDPLKLSGNVNIDLSTTRVKVPALPGVYELSLYLGSSLLNKTNIEIEKFKVLQNLNPRYVVLKNPTEFKIVFGKNVSITDYSWDFGDGTIVKTDKNSAVHMYNSSGTYKMKIDVVSSDGIESKGEFDVVVSSAKDSVSYTIDNYLESLNNAESDILALFPEWAQTSIKKRIIGNLTSEITRLKQNAASAAAEFEFINILDQLYSMKVPTSVRVFAQGQSPYYPDYSKISLDKFSQMGAGETADSGRISAWLNDYYSLNLDFKMISVSYKDGEETLGGLFNLKMTPKQKKDVKNFVIIGGTDLETSPVYNDEPVGDDARGFVFDSVSQREVNFIDYSVKNFDEIKVFIAPEFSELEIKKYTTTGCNFDGVCGAGESWTKCKDCNNKLIMTLIGVIIGIAVVIGGFLVWWYKTKYESHLFKEKKDVYNITQFVKSAKKQKLSKSEIYTKLKKEGWNSEQVGYAMGKASGGIFGIFSKLFSKNKK
jgi:PKD repeat protein